MGILEIVVIAISYFIVNQLAFEPISESLIRKEIRWQQNLKYLTNETVGAIKKSKRNDFVSSLRNQISNFLITTGNFTPLVKNVKETLEYQHLSYRIVDSIISCLSRYKIQFDELPKLRMQLKARPPPCSSNEEITEHYLLTASQKLEINPLSIKLIYYDFLGDSELRNTIWQQIKNDKGELKNEYSQVKSLLTFLKSNNIVN